MKQILKVWVGFSVDLNKRDRVLTLMGESIVVSGIDPLSAEGLFLYVSFFASTCFGLIHLSAWEYSFPTDLEKKLWRISAMVAICDPILIVGLMFPTKCMTTIRTKGPLITCFAVVLCIVITLSYVIARITLIGIMFSSLRSLSPSAHETVPWTELFPHL